MGEAVFLDTNIILDFVQARGAASLAAKELFKLKESGEIELFASTLSMATTAYFIQKSKIKPAPIIADLLELVNVIDLTGEVLNSAILSKFEDFEDALQYYSALKVRGIDCIITRNKKDYSWSRIPVFTTSEFLNLRSN